MKTFVVYYVDGWLHPQTCEVVAETADEALAKFKGGLTTIDQDFVQAITGVGEKPETEGN